MTFDFHLHAAPGQDLAPLLRAMDEHGVEMGAVCTVVGRGEDADAANRGIVAHVRAHPDRLVGLACVVPTDADAPDRLRHWVHEEGLRGLKLHPSMQSFFPSEPRVRPTIEAAAELGIPVLVHTGTVPIPGTRSRHDDPLEE